MSRREFPASVKRAVRDRANGHCEVCSQPLAGRRGHFDHIQPDGLGGEPTLANCQMLCPPCHRAKTHEQDNPVMAKADRQRRANDGTKPKRQGFRGWRKMNGDVVWRD